MATSPPSTTATNVHFRTVTSDVYDYINKLRHRNESSKQEATELKQTLSQLQCVKEGLLQRRVDMADDIEKRRREIEDAREKLPDESWRTMFDGIFALIDGCYHKHLLELELKEQLTVARALREDEQYVELIEGLSGVGKPSDDVIANKPLSAWYKEMKQDVKNGSDGTTDDACFYDIKMSSDRHAATSLPSSSSLCFTTRHKGFCVTVTIKHTSSRSLISSSTHLEGLQTKGQEYLANGLSAAGFVQNVVWPLMEEQMDG